MPLPKLNLKDLDQKFAKMKASQAKLEQEEKEVEAEASKATARGKGLDKIPD